MRKKGITNIRTDSTFEDHLGDNSGPLSTFSIISKNIPIFRITVLLTLAINLGTQTTSSACSVLWDAQGNKRVLNK